MGVFFKLAELMMVTVPGSVEDESMFSDMKYLRNPQRNRLQQEHLTCCARGFKSEHSAESFPYPAAIREWLSVKKRRGVKGRQIIELLRLETCLKFDIGWTFLRG